MKNLAKPEADERHRHPPLWMAPLVTYLEWCTAPGAYVLTAWMDFNTRFVLGFVPVSTSDA